MVNQGAISSDRGAVHDPPLGRIVGQTPVQHGPVVPDHQIACLPCVRINGFRAHAELGQRLGQRPTFVHGPADHMRTVTADTKNLRPVRGWLRTSGWCGGANSSFSAAVTMSPTIADRE